MWMSNWQKDYTWPYVSSKCRTQPPIKPIVVKDCTCTDSRQVLEKLWDENLEECVNWSRMGPMGRLLEPKIYPKIVQVPEAERDVTRFDQLRTICLKEEYPDLYGALKKSLPNGTITRVDADRMKTTYQTDYSDPAAARLTQRDMAVIDTNGQHLRCRMPIKIIIEDGCPSYDCFPSSRCNGSTSVWKRDYKRKNGLKREKKCEDVEKRQMLLPSWKSEYQDSISKIGHAIMRVKLHHAKRKALPVQYRCKISTSRKSFFSITHQDFNWPYTKPLKPLSPPMDTIAIQPYLLRLNPEDCKCAVHGFEAGKARYRQLADKERRLYDELIKVNREMTDLTSSMLDNVCDMEETMKSVYKTDYTKRGLPVTRYRPLMAAVDSPIGLPITSAIFDLKDAYRDRTRFKGSAMENLMMQPVKTIKLLNDKQVPEMCSFWDELFVGCSEYMDTISKMGLINMKNQQRYLAPLPVSRKLDDCVSLIKGNV